MNAVLEPSLFCISEEKWLDANERDNFLAFFLKHLDCLDEYDIANIYWHDSLWAIIYSNPTLLPWRHDACFRNSMMSIIYRKINARFFYISEDISFLSESCFDPLLRQCESGELHKVFLQMLQYVLTKAEDVYIVFGLLNCDFCGKVSCGCNAVIPNIFLVKCCEDWLRFMNGDEFWPTHKHDEVAFRKGLNINMQKVHGFGKKVDYFCDSNFIAEVFCKKANPLKLYWAMAKRLAMSQHDAASDEGLHDEPVMGREGVRRFRISDSVRVHYFYDCGRIRFCNYYSEAEHDLGL